MLSFPDFPLLLTKVCRVQIVFHPTTLHHLVFYGHTYSKSMDQPGKVGNPARGRLNRENEYFPVRVRA